MIFISILCGLFGALSGSENSSKYWRRFLIPVIIFISLYFKYQELLWLVFTLILPLSLGYGQPCEDDKGCKISIFLNKWIKNKRILETLTRAIISILYCLCLLSVTLFTQNWNIYLFGCISIFLSNIFIGGDSFLQDEGTFKFFGKDLLWEEFAIYFTLSLVFISI